MKNEIQLRKSYEKQKDIFEASKRNKAENIQKQIEALESKILSLQKTRSELTDLKKKVLEEPFQDFEFYLKQARQASESASTKGGS